MQASRLPTIEQVARFRPLWVDSVEKLGSGAERCMAGHRKGDVVGFAWAENGMGYSLVGGPEAATNLHPIADEARRQFRLKS